MIKHSYDFDPTCGYSREMLERIRPDKEPAGFRSFWEKTYDETMKIRPNIKTQKLWSPDSALEVYAVYYESLGGITIGAWLTRPHNSKGGLVIGHGYDGAAAPEVYPDFTVITPCSRGFNLSLHPELPWRSNEHVLHGIEKRDSYIIRGAVADIWLAATVMIHLFPETAKNLNYSGSSYGGGLGTLALAWDKRFKSGLLSVPTFGLHRMRLKYKSIGSAESVRLYSHCHPEVVDVLKYFDSANAASHIRMPVICVPALFDPVVIPPGQFAVANAIPDDFKTVFVLPAGHFNSPENNKVLDKVVAAARTMFLS